MTFLKINQAPHRMIATDFNETLTKLFSLIMNFKNEISNMIIILGEAKVQI